MVLEHMHPVLFDDYRFKCCTPTRSDAVDYWMFTAVWALVSMNKKCVLIGFRVSTFIAEKIKVTNRLVGTANTG